MGEDADACMGQHHLLLVANRRIGETDNMMERFFKASCYMRLKLIIYMLVICSCDKKDDPSGVQPVTVDSSAFFSITEGADTLKPTIPTGVATGDTRPEELVTFARSLKGIPYKYASSDPLKGFDCSGFVSYVFTHFGIEVPRSSIEFTHFGRDIDPKEAKPGDLILFTGTSKESTVVGHMGIISGTDSVIRFVHATSGSEYAVTETELNEYYLGRYVKTIRLFERNDR